MSEFLPGQRWISEMEPELGLGKVVEADHRRIRIHFAAVGATRQYAKASAPLARVRYKSGDEVQRQDGSKVTVKEVVERDGLFVYVGTDVEVPEDQLSDAISFDKPEDRLLAGQGNNSHTFSLRYDTLLHVAKQRKSAVRGFLGGRIDLIPHQLYIAHEVANRLLPRVLLADEVGLGKTIEACLIVHRLLLSGRASRVLLLVPEPLINQWIVEMYRRFNLWFQLYDEERCVDAMEQHPDSNPFDDNQLVICGIDFLAGKEDWREQLVKAGWDTVVVDEAHHLRWTEEEASPEYALVEALARSTPGLLLLTATPEQLGQAGHFARLRLLDPDRYTDLAAYSKESEQYHKVAEIAASLMDGASLSKDEADSLSTLLPGEKKDNKKRIAALQEGDAEAKQQFVEELLDLHGVGRVMFRNTRAAMTGFPERKAQPDRLDAAQAAGKALLLEEFKDDAGLREGQAAYDYSDDPRITWLVSLLKKDKERKVLLICRSKEKVAAAQEALQQQINTKIALFHEELSLNQRDRNAAWFAEDDGAQVLLCSEIGSEGRNFQFVSDLVLFDLPLDPELLEQRIGRLDRIGQKNTINIHIPYVAGSAQEVLYRWYQEGLNAFEASVVGGSDYVEAFRDRLIAAALHAAEADADKDIAALIADTRSLCEDVSGRIESGRDRLLEMNSYRPLQAADVELAIQNEDSDPALEKYCLRLFQHFGVNVEELAERSYLLKPGNLLTDAFPTIPDDGLSVSFDRQRALVREDIGFFTWDHPMIIGAMDVMLGSEYGNTSFALWRDRNSRVIMMEAIFVLECLAPPALQADRFLPPTPLRVVVNQFQEDSTDEFDRDELNTHLTDGPAFRLLNNQQVSQMLVPKLFSFSRETAESRAEPLKQEALDAMEKLLGAEIERLRALKAVNDHVRDEEISLAENHRSELKQHIEAARLRLDALRLIWRGPSDHRLLR